MLDNLWNLEEYSWEVIDPSVFPIKIYCCPADF